MRFLDNSVFNRLRWNFSAPSMLEEMSGRLGSTFNVNIIPGSELVVTRDPNLIRAIFADTGKHLHAGSANKLVLGHFLGEGSVLLLDGARHKAHRRVMVPCFHGQILKDHVEGMQAIIAENIARWPRNTWTSVLPLSQDISLEVIVKSIFGFRSGHSDYPRVLRIIRGIFSDSSPGTSLAIFFPVLMQLAEKMSSRVTNLKNDFRELAGIIEAHSQSADLSEKSILAHFLRAQGQAEDKFSFSEIADEMIGLLLAGNETTAVAMAWAAYWMNQDPSVIPAIAQSLKEEPDPTKNRWVDSFVKEVLRISPIFLIVAREVENEFTVGPHVFRRGQRLAPAVYLANRNPDIFKEPLKFKTDRFLELDPKPYEYFPFGGGERRCIGYALATLELKLFTAALVNGPRIELRDSGVPRPERRGIAFTPHKGLRVKFSKSP